MKKKWIIFLICVGVVVLTWLCYSKSALDMLDHRSDTEAYKQPWFHDVALKLHLPESIFLYSGWARGQPVIVAIFKVNDHWIEEVKSHVFYDKTEGKSFHFLSEIIEGIGYIYVPLMRYLEKAPQQIEAYQDINLYKGEAMSGYKQFRSVEIDLQHPATIAERKINRIYVRMAYKPIGDTGENQVIMGLVPIGDWDVK